MRNNSGSGSRVALWGKEQDRNWIKYINDFYERFALDERHVPGRDFSLSKTSCLFEIDLFTFRGDTNVKCEFIHHTAEIKAAQSYQLH